METSDPNELRAEIDRLSRELDQASSEKIQSAKYGLGLLEEKSMLQQKCEELETLYENAKHELEITQEVREALAEWQCSRSHCRRCCCSPCTNKLVDCLFF